MKKIIFTIALATLAGFSSWAQKITDDNVPAVVADAFKVKFTAADKVSWEMDYDNFEATFKMNKIELTSTFDKDGKWIQTETPVNHSNLPPAVKVCLQKQFDVYKESSISKLENADGTKYIFVIEYNGLEYNVIISDKGDLVKKEEIKEYKKN